jgi:WD40 repeat protein
MDLDKSPSRCAFSSDGVLLAVSGQRSVASPYDIEASISLWQTKDKLVTVRSARGFEGDFTSLAFAPFDRVLVSSACVFDGDRQDGLVQFWDTRNGDEIRRISISDAGASIVAISPNGRTVAIGTQEDRSRIKIRDAATCREIASLEGHGNRVTSLAFSRDGSRLVSSGCDSLVRVWDSKKWVLERQCEVGPNEPASQIRAAVSATPDIAAVGVDSKCFVLNYATGERLHALVAPAGETINFLSFTHDGKYLVTCGKRSLTLATLSRPAELESSAVTKVGVWDARTGRLGAHVEVAKRGQVSGLACSPTGPEFATTDMITGEIRIWRISSESRKDRKKEKNKEK